MDTNDYVDVKFDIFEYVGQRAQVRKSLTISVLKEEILREFDDIPTDMTEDYAIYLKGMKKPLEVAKTLSDLDIQPQDELIFDHIRSSIRQMLPADQVVYFVEEITGRIFEIQWQPAIIGRPSMDIDHNIVLAVNLESLPDGNYISRQHAEYIRGDGRHFIKSLAEYNPVFLNGKKLSYGHKYEIRHNDKLTLGPRKITMFFRTALDERKSESKSSPKSTPVSRAVVEAPKHTFINNAEEQLQKVQTPNLMILSAMIEENLGKAILLNTFPYLIGRTHRLLTKENFVSRIHAEISRVDETGKYYIVDKDSTNGVTVDGEQIPPSTPVEIRNGTRIGLGHELVLRLNT